MNRLQNILIIGGFAVVMIAFYGGLILWVSSCEKSYKEETLPGFQEVKMEMTLDSLYKMAGVNSRVLVDGIFDISWLGDGFNQQNKNLFDEQCNHQEDFLKVTYPFDSLWTAGKLRFTRKLVSGNLNCKTLGFESLDCNWDKVYKAAFAGGATPDFIHIFSLGNGYGTGNGGISVLGIGTGMAGSLDMCSYWSKLPKINAHEMGHGLGCDHALMPTYPANIMSQATNGGCELGSYYLPQHKQIILNYINSRIN